MSSEVTAQNTGPIIACVAAASSALIGHLDAQFGTPGASSKHFAAPKKELGHTMQTTGTHIKAGTQAQSPKVELDMVGDFIVDSYLQIEAPAIEYAAGGARSAAVLYDEFNAAGATDIEKALGAKDGSLAYDLPYAAANAGVAYIRYAPFLAIESVTGYIGSHHAHELTGVSLWIWNYVCQKGALRSADKWATASFGKRADLSKSEGIKAKIYFPFVGSPDKPYMLAKAVYSQLHIKVKTRSLAAITEGLAGGMTFNSADAHPSVSYLQDAAYICGAFKQHVVDFQAGSGVKTSFTKLREQSSSAAAGTNITKETNVRGTLAQKEIFTLVADELLQNIVPADVVTKINGQTIGQKAAFQQDDTKCQCSCDEGTVEAVAHAVHKTRINSGNSGMPGGKLDSAITQTQYTSAATGLQHFTLSVELSVLEYINNIASLMFM